MDRTLKFGSAIRRTLPAFWLVAFFDLQGFQRLFSSFLNDPVDFLQENIYKIGLLTLLGYLVLLLLIIWIIRIIRNTIGGGGFGGGRDKTLSPREARRAFKHGDFLRAGELYEALGDLETAARCYREVKAYWNLGRMAEQQRKWDEAAQYFYLASDFDKALSLYQRSGNFSRAAEICASSKRLGMAAELYEKAKQYKDAAAQYEKLDNLVKAGAMHELAGEGLKAAELYERHFLRERGAKSDAVTGPLEQIALQSGKLFIKAGQSGRAAEIFSLAGAFNPAGEAYISCGEKTKAAEAFASAKNFARAARIYQELGETLKGQRLLAEQFREERKFRQAADAFAQAEDFLEAAEMYERVEDHEKAGEMFLAAGDFGRASEIFIQLGELGRAAEALEKGRRFEEAAEFFLKSGDKSQAARVWERAENFYQAGLLYRQIGKMDESIAVLQKVESSSEEYFKASLTLGQMFVEKGMLEAAKERYQKIISQSSIGPRNLEFYYQLALIHEKMKDFDEALSLYEKILAEDIHYKDVRGKSDLLKKALTTVKKALEGSRIDKGKGAGLAQSPEGRYRVIKKIGQGGMGVVYQAEDTVLKRIVAYKVLPPTLKEHPAVLTSFLQEARVSAALNHPNIVTIYDTGRNGDDIFITMEFVDGVSLKENLEKKPNQAISDLVQIMKEMCEGVSYAHSRNVIHRDIKPANVMIGKDGAVKIMDFGLAKVLSQSMADKTSVKGTPLYMSPEQILGQNVDHQSDIYSLGCSFYRMVAGRPPFIQGDVYYHHLHTVPIPPKQVNPQVPDTLNRIILRALEKEKGKRYKTVKDLLNDLM
ncbi:MAG TPA: protein kinase [Nitrospiria bacterium]|nr:protein kinase [Nitrospiria bacterium]